MYVSLTIMFCICMIKILPSYSQGKPSTTKTGLGISSCFYYGNVETICNQPDVAVDKLPDTCTSFFANELAVKNDFNVYTPVYKSYDYGFLQTLGKSGKNLYIDYSHEDDCHFVDILNGNETMAMQEINNLISVMKDIPGITGLLIKDFMHIPEEYGGLTDQIAKYIDLVKQNAKVEVGLLFEQDFIDYYNKPTYPWLDLSKLSSCVNFFVISLENFNSCTPELRNTGVTSFKGSASYTLEKLESALQKAKLPKDKLYFLFILRPVPNIFFSNICNSYHVLCTSPDLTKDWCADTQETYYDQGCWAQRNGVGFIGKYVDIDDPLNSCECGAFPSFNAILTGLNGSAKPPACRLFDRQP